MQNKAGQSTSRKLGTICQTAAKLTGSRLALLYIVDHKRKELHWLQGLAASSIPRDHLRIVRRLHIPLNASGGLYTRACQEGIILQAAPSELQSTYGDLMQRWIPVAALSLVPIQSASESCNFLLVLGSGKTQVADRQLSANQIENLLKESIQSWQPLLATVHQRWLARKTPGPISQPPQLREATILSLSIEHLHRLAPVIPSRDWNRLMHELEYIYEVFLMMDCYQTLMRGPDRLTVFAWRDRLGTEKILEHALGLQARLEALIKNAVGPGSKSKLHTRLALTLGPVQALRLGSRLQIWGPAVEAVEMLRRTALDGQILCTMQDYKMEPGAFNLIPRGKVRLPGQQESHPLYMLTTNP